MTADLIIFDCDGILVDTEKITDAVFAEALAGLGLKKTVDEVHDAYLGMAWRDVVAAVETELGRPLPRPWLDDLFRAEEAAFRAELAPVDGVRAVVEAAVASGREICVASSGSLSKMTLTLGITDLLPHFEGRLFSADHVQRAKPHPDVFLYAAQEMGHSPNRCAVIEDSVRGVQGAAAAGMAVYAYAGDPRADRAAFDAAGATIFTHMAELKTLLALQPAA